MFPNLPRPPLTYLITGGQTTHATRPSSIEFTNVLKLVERAVAAGVTLVQLREKSMTARTLHELASSSSGIAKGSTTRVLVNDRADIARAAGCDGVHLTTQSLEASVVRRSFGEDFLIGVSAHTLEEARAARIGGADFVVFGPVFDTPSKHAYGPPLGLHALAGAARALAPFPVVAIGGVAKENCRDVLLAGAAGVAAIRMFTETSDMREVVSEIMSAGS